MSYVVQQNGTVDTTSFRVRYPTNPSLPSQPSKRCTGRASSLRRSGAFPLRCPCTSGSSSSPVLGRPLRTGMFDLIASLDKRRTEYKYVGWVYILRNRAFRDPLLKIGQSRRPHRSVPLTRRRHRRTTGL